MKVMAMRRVHVCHHIRTLATRMEGMWSSVLADDQLAPYALPKYLDSRKYTGASTLRLQVENVAYCTRVFRKMHIEVAAREDGLQVFHSVVYPRVQYDLPILSMDLVAKDERVSLAIADPCPVTPGLDLPRSYHDMVGDLQAKYRLESNRRVPEWGSAIFSRLCIIMRPGSKDDLLRFMGYALDLAELHAHESKKALVTGDEATIRWAHARYCKKQLENDKTRRVLEASFGAEMAERYMKEVMFDN